VPPSRTRVPVSSNYFTNRDDLLTQAGGRVYERLQPDAITIAQALERPRDRVGVTRLLQDSVMLLYLVLNWLIVERLTLPDVFPEAQINDLIAEVVERVLPSDAPDTSRDHP
jgi:hypothetical protein